MSYYITTESNSEIPYQWEDLYNVKVLRMPYNVDGEEYFYDLGRETDIKAFYDTMRRGATVTTTLRNPAEVYEFWEPFLQEGKDILHIAFSSALSSTFNNEQTARAELLEKYPDRKIILVDTMTISGPMSLLVKAAIDMKEQGATMEEIAAWVEANKMKANALFTVDSLEYLRRGGRVSGAAAFFGSMLEIKPVIHITSEGKLTPIEKIKGRKKALKFLLETCKKTIENPQEQTIIVCQADVPEEGEAFAAQVREALNPKDVEIRPVGPVIGSHAGPGTIAICYFSKTRDLPKA